jgi:hypothetical protein
VEHNSERLIDEKEAGAYLHVSARTLQGFRLRREGPAYVKIGGRVRYRLRDLDKYLDDHTVIPAVE